MNLFACETKEQIKEELQKKRYNFLYNFSKQLIARDKELERTERFIYK